MPNFDNASRRTTEQRLNRATPFRVNPAMEDLARLREERPAKYDALPPRVHIALGLYENDRANHEHLAGDAA